MTNLSNIVETLQGDYQYSDCKDWITNEKHCYNALDSIDLKNFASDINKKAINTNPVSDNDLINKDILNNDYWDRRKHVTLTCYKKDIKEHGNIKSLRVYSIEVFIERIIAYLKNNKNTDTNSLFYWNQFNLNRRRGKSKEAIDINIINNDTYNYVELKAEQGETKTNSPIYAIIESVKNYYLTPPSIRNKIKTLTVLAPKSYWERLTMDDFNKIDTIRTELQGILNINIDILYIDITDNEINSICDNFKNYVEKHIHNKQETIEKEKEITITNKAPKTGKYDTAIEIKLDKIKDKDFLNKASIKKLTKWLPVENLFK